MCKNFLLLVCLTVSTTVGLSTPDSAWGGFYSKISLGYGAPNIVGDQENITMDYFWTSLSGSGREICYLYPINQHVAVGIESGLLFTKEDKNSKDNFFPIKGEIAPQLSYVYNDLRGFVGVGLGFANGTGFKGLPNSLEKHSRLNVNDFGGFWLVEAGVEYIISSHIFIGGKYQYERTLTTYRDIVYVDQHNFLFTIGVLIR